MSESFIESRFKVKKGQQPITTIDKMLIDKELGRAKIAADVRQQQATETKAPAKAKGQGLLVSKWGIKIDPERIK